MVEPAMCDEKTESGEVSDLEASAPAYNAKISFFHLENCVAMKLEKTAARGKIKNILKL